VAGFWDRLFNGGGRSRALALARSAELRGELARAAELFEQGGRSDEAARVRKARALAVLAATANVPVTASRRPPLLEAAADLEALGDFARAAEAYDRARDVEGQARALAGAGEIDRLDDLLEAEQARDRGVRARRAGHEDFDALVGSGRRREAFDRAQGSPDAALRGRGLALIEHRLSATIVRATLRGRTVDLVLGDRVIIGRAPDIDAPASETDRSPTGAITVASLALSRSHLAIARRDGVPHVRDLESRHGTTVGGVSLHGEVPVGQGLDLRLGGEVPCVVRPADERPGAVAIDVGGLRHVAPLGPVTLGVGRWSLALLAREAGEAGEAREAREARKARKGWVEWVELVTHDDPPAFANGLRLASRITLLAGDAFSDEAGGDEVLRFPLPSSG
jgi:tetratricopeptide (TPR) repeat protein